jgi:hypothetical protein
MARPSILEAVERKRRAEAPASVARQDATTTAPKQKAAHKDAPKTHGPAAAISREGKINVSAYFPPEVKASLRLVQAKRGGKVQDLLAEALNLLFAKYNVPETAPIQKSE